LDQVATEYDLAERLAQLERPQPPNAAIAVNYVQQHTIALKKGALEQIRSELLSLQAENNAKMELLRNESVALKRRAERVSQMQALIDEVTHVYI
jgi:cell division protein FtsB